jgi:hypothetical protein
MLDNNQTNKAENISAEERIQLLKSVFDTLEVVERAEFANWCHEEIEKDSGKVLREKMQKGNEAFNKFIATSYDKIINTGTIIYNTTNEMVQSAIKDGEEDNQSENTSKGSGIFD